MFISSIFGLVQVLRVCGELHHRFSARDLHHSTLRSWDCQVATSTSSVSAGVQESLEWLAESSLRSVAVMSSSAWVVDRQNAGPAVSYYYTSYD